MLGIRVFVRVCNIISKRTRGWPIICFMCTMVCVAILGTTIRRLLAARKLWLTLLFR